MLTIIIIASYLQNRDNISIEQARFHTDFSFFGGWGWGNDNTAMM